MQATSAQLTTGFIKFDNLGNLYVTDPKNYRVYRIDNTGIFHLVAGSGLAANNGDGGSATEAGIYYPTGLAFDSCDNVYISNVDYNRIRKITYPFCHYLSVGSISNQQIEVAIYPNPAYDVLIIDNLPTAANYTLFNVLGNIEQSGILKKGNNSISIKALPGGVYILELIDDEGRRALKKIIKE